LSRKRTVLVVHDYYQMRGGEDICADGEMELLRSAGHRVIPYTIHNREVERIGRLKTAARTLWSSQDHRGIQRVIGQRGVEIVHLHNTFPLISPAAVHAAKGMGIPVVQTVHNYRFFCLNGCFFTRGQVCERCFGRDLAWPGILRRCYRDSLAGSSVAAATAWVHGRLLNTWSSKVDLLIALSEFGAEKLRQAGMAPERIVVKPNFLLPEPSPPTTAIRNQFVFVGRLSVEKGLHTLMRAWRRAALTDHELRIVGEGPLKEELKAQAVPGVVFEGALDRDQVLARMAESKALIFPSEWYETFGRVAMEASAMGTPVVASDIGAVREMVEEGTNGWLFPPGDPDALADRIRQLTDPGAVSREACRAFYRARFTAERNLELLEAVYDRVVQRSRSAE
jgi:glycosyltransferase involved in cell wall biosynthesis